MKWLDNLSKYPIELVVAIIGVAGVVVGVMLNKFVPWLWKGICWVWGWAADKLGARSDRQRFEQKYRDQLVEELRFLQTRGIRITAPLPLELEKVYVSLKLTDPTRDRRERNIRRYFERDEQDEDQLDDLEELDHEPERMSIEEALRRLPSRLVILGGSGTGKSTLLNYLALKCARGYGDLLGLSPTTLPILVRLRDVVREKLDLTSANLSQLSVCRELVSTCPDDLFRQHLEQGNCLVLLDGMDEVTTVEQRQQVSDQISELVAAHPRNRYIVTSRPSGYSGAALAGFAHTQVCDFDDDDVEAFAGNWCRAVALAQHGTQSEAAVAVAERHAKDEATVLVEAIRSSESVRRLTVNPLLLTIVALVHRYRAEIPRRRVDLYDECVQVLLRYWDAAKGLAGQMDVGSKRNALLPLAYAMHRARVREWPTSEVEAELARGLVAVGEQGTNARDFLLSIRTRSGLLVERGTGLYGFSHLTFQEYLTACHLRQLPEGLDTVMDVLDDPWWHEVIQLYAAVGDGTALIERILSCPLDKLTRPIFRAASCLADVSSIAPDVGSRVLSALDALVQDQTCSARQRKSIMWLGRLGASPCSQQAGNLLVKRLQDEADHIRGFSAEALGHLGRFDEGLLQALLNQLSDESSLVRGRTATALGSVGRHNDAVVAALLSHFPLTSYSEMSYVSDALGSLARADDSVVTVLMERAVNQSAHVRGIAAEALGKIGRPGEMVEAFLLEQLRDGSAHVRGRVAEALGRVGQSGDVVAALLVLLQDEEEAVRGRAAEALGRLGRDHSVISALMELTGDVAESVRGRAALSLGQLGRGNKTVRSMLRALVADESAFVRGRTADALARLGYTDEMIVSDLASLLQDEDEQVRGRAVHALGQLGRDDEQVVGLMVRRLQDESAYVIHQTTISLVQIGQGDEALVSALLDLLDKGKTSYVRKGAAMALNGMERHVPILSDAMIERLRSMLDEQLAIDLSWDGIKYLSDVAWQLLDANCERNGSRG